MKQLSPWKGMTTTYFRVCVRACEPAHECVWVGGGIGVFFARV